MDTYVEKGLGGYPRSPIPEADDAVKKMCDLDMVEVLELERSL